MLRSTQARPMRVARRAGVALLAACLSFGVFGMGASRAAAYCRETVDAQSTGPCVEKAGAARLHWTRSCLTQVFNDQFFARTPLISEAEIRSEFHQSFQTWADVDCGGGRTLFAVQQAAGTTSTSTSEFVFDAHNEAIIVGKTLSEWVQLGHDPQALALTLLWHDADSGEILDVDTELNEGSVRYANCDKPCSQGMIDLRNTITHEGGHLLGLGHSTVLGSTMYDSAPDGEISKRTLAQDDIAGYCALQLPEFTCTSGQCVCPPPPIYPKKRTTSGWSCMVGWPLRSESAPGMPLSWLVFAAVGGVLGWRARRKR
ncbi:MAG TPA: matrixin family metalloprotease [Polyangiales bacterium]